MDLKVVEVILIWVIGVLELECKFLKVYLVLFLL